MGESEKPKWVKNFEDTFISPSPAEYWKKSPSGDKPVHDGSDNKTVNGWRGGLSDTSSMGSRVTSSSGHSERARARRLGLFLILIIVAFIIAALIGLLVYFLLMRDQPLYHRVSGVQGSVRVLNLTYTDDMANISSQSFREIAEPFCQELDLYMRSSNYSDRYTGCTVTNLSNVAEEADCLCLGAKKGNVMVTFRLLFNGSHEKEDLRQNIFDIIEKGVRKVKVGDIVIVLLRRFLVDMRLDWRVPYDMIEGQVTLPVYNLNYTTSLSDPKSAEFLALARPFCNDVDKIMKNEKSSWLSFRYISCHVTGFTQHTSDKRSVSFTLEFNGLDPRPLQQGVLYILLNGARKADWYGQSVKLIGPLLVTPFDLSFILRPANSTQPPPNVTYVSVILPVFNLSLTADLMNPNSVLMNNISKEFCSDMTRFYGKSVLREKFHSCSVYGFRPNATRIEFQVGFLGDGWTNMRENVVKVIREFAPETFYGLLHLFKVGPLYVILDQIVGNGLELHTSLHVMNFTYTSALDDLESGTFVHHALRFCKDLEEFYRKSIYADRLLHCKVKAFTQNPVRVHFYLVFHGTNLDDLTTSYIDVIRQYGKQMYWNGWLVYLVGDLLVLPEPGPHSLYPTNITTFPSTNFYTLSLSPTTSLFQPAGDMTQAVIIARLYNFTFDKSVLDPGSSKFRSLEHKFCLDVARVYQASFLSPIFSGCGIERYDPLEGDAIFNLYFDTPPAKDLERDVVYVLVTDSPKVKLNHSNHLSVEVLHLGDLYLTWRFIVLNSLHRSDLPSTPLILPTPTVLMTSTLTPTWTSQTAGSAVFTATIINKTNVTLFYHLFNFTYVPQLGNPASDAFESYERPLCLEIQEIFKASSLFNMIYAGCEISNFGASPPSIQFHLHFIADVNEALLRATTETLERSRPHLNTSLDGRTVYEILPVGRLLLILENRTATFSEATMEQTAMATPELMTSAPQTFLLSTWPTPDGTMLILYYKTYGLGYSSALADPDSSVFREYRHKVCADLNKWYRGNDSPFFFNYHSCDLKFFTPEPEGVAFSIILKARTSEDTGRHIRTFLEFKAPKRFIPGYNLMEVGGLLLIVDQYNITTSYVVVPSDSPTPSTSSIATSTDQYILLTTTFKPSPTSSELFLTTAYPNLNYFRFLSGLADFVFTDDLYYKMSPRYQRIENGFCRDIDKFFKKSFLGDAYRGCSIDDYSKSIDHRFPDNVTFTFAFDLKYSPEIHNLVRYILLDQAPRGEIDGYSVLVVGDLNLIIDTIQDKAPDNPSSGTQLPTRTVASTYIVTISPTHTSTSTPTTLSTTSPIAPSTTRLTTTPTTTPTTKPTTTPTTRPTTTPTTTTTTRSTTTPTTTTTTRPTTTPTTTTTTRPTTTPTTTTTTRPTTTPTTTTTTRPTTTPTTTTTTRPTTTPTTTTTTRPTTTPTTTTTTRPTTTPTTTTTTTTTTRPTTTPTTTTTTRPTTTSTTTPTPFYFLRMSFEVVNLTWQEDLNDINSTLFKKYSQEFCAELNSIFGGRKEFQEYVGCKIDYFGGEPLRANFSLQFRPLKGFDPQMMQRLVVSLITEHAQRVTVNNVVSLKVGDGTAYQFTYGLQLWNFSLSLLDKSSYEFRVAAFEFCKDIDHIFQSVGIRNIRQRYQGCYVNEIGYDESPNVTFTLIFNQTEPISFDSLNGIIQYSKTVPGVDYLTIGNIHVIPNPDGIQYFLMLDTIATHSYPYTTTTPPAFYTFIQFSLRFLRPEWRADMADQTSFAFQHFAQFFCQDVSTWIEAEKPDYIGCEVLEITRDPNTIKAEVKFRGEQPATLQNDVDTILLESPDWEMFGNVIGLRIGDFYIYEESLLIDQRTAPIVSSTSSSVITTTTPPTTPVPTRPSNPCVLGGEYYRHPSLCDRFLQCADGFAIEIPCGPGSIYTDNTCKTPEPGFQCVPLPGYE